MQDKLDKIIKILHEHDKRIRALEKSLSDKPKTHKEKPTRSPRDLTSLAKTAAVTEEQIRCVFDFDEDDVTLIVEVEGESEAEKQFTAAMCILTAYHYCYGVDEIKSQTLRKKLKWLGIKSLVNLSTNMARYRKYIIPKGKTRSPESTYRLTLPGLNRGIEFIRQLASS